jgi:hypothetical protein
MITINVNKTAKLIIKYMNITYNPLFYIEMNPINIRNADKFSITSKLNPERRFSRSYLYGRYINV